MTDNSKALTLTEREQAFIKAFINADAEMQNNVEKLLTGEMSIEEAEAIYNINLRRS